MSGLSIPRLETERLVLRAQRVEDFDASAAMWANEHVTLHIGGRPFTREESWSRLLRYAGLWAHLGYGYWAIEEKASRTYVGELGFADFKRDLDPSLEGVPEIGWALVHERRGIGFATEAVRAAVAWADEALDAPRTACLIGPDNLPSMNVARKSGYTKWCSTAYHGGPTVLYERARGASTA